MTEQKTKRVIRVIWVVIAAVLVGLAVAYVGKFGINFNL